MTKTRLTGTTTRCTAGALALAALLGAAHAQSPDDYSIDVELRTNVLLGNGTPANDMPGTGIGARVSLNDGWFVSGALEFYSFDFESPIDVAGSQPGPSGKAINAKTTTTVVSAGLGREYGFSDSAWSWFWNLGIGAGFPDVSTESGTLQQGGAFNAVTEAGTEIHLMSKLGASYRISQRWRADFVARLEHHFIDYKVTDSLSGSTGTIESQTPMGGHVAMRYMF